MSTLPPAPELTTLDPVEILDDYDGPRLFTVEASDGRRLLAYQCGETASADQFLLVPTDRSTITALQANDVPLRDALTGAGIGWRLDRFRDGRLTCLTAIDIAALPAAALPMPEARLHPHAVDNRSDAA